MDSCLAHSWHIIIHNSRNGIIMATTSAGVSEMFKGGKAKPKNIKITHKVKQSNSTKVLRTNKLPRP